jgi:chromosome segregation ATPase
MTNKEIQVKIAECDKRLSDLSKRLRSIHKQIRDAEELKADLNMKLNGPPQLGLRVYD